MGNETIIYDNIVEKSTSGKLDKKIRKMRQKTPKAELLDWIYLKFRNKKFVKSEIIGTPLVHFTPRLNKLKNSGWLNSQKISLKAHKDNRNYYLSSKAKKYLWKFGSFTNLNGPLMRKREPHFVEVMKEVEKNIYDREKVVGEY